MVKKLRPITRSDLFWALFMNLSIMAVILAVLQDSIYIWILALVIFIYGAIIGHSKKIRHKVDYE